MLATKCREPRPSVATGLSTASCAQFLENRYLFRVSLYARACKVQKSRHYVDCCIRISIAKFCSPHFQGEKSHEINDFDPCLCFGTFHLIRPMKERLRSFACQKHHRKINSSPDRGASHVAKKRQMQRQVANHRSPSGIRKRGDGKLLA